MARNICTITAPTGKLFSLDLSGDELIYKIRDQAGRLFPHTFPVASAEECRDVMRHDLIAEAMVWEARAY